MFLYSILEIYTYFNHFYKNLAYYPRFLRLSSKSMILVIRRKYKNVFSSDMGYDKKKYIVSKTR